MNVRYVAVTERQSPCRAVVRFRPFAITGHLASEFVRQISPNFTYWLGGKASRKMERALPLRCTVLHEDNRNLHITA
jgi:hypothetical protein